jgi:hypothetical protein
VRTPQRRIATDRHVVQLEFILSGTPTMRMSMLRFGGPAIFRQQREHNYPRVPRIPCLDHELSPMSDAIALVAGQPQFLFERQSFDHSTPSAVQPCFVVERPPQLLVSSPVLPAALAGRRSRFGSSMGYIPQKGKKSNGVCGR